MSRSAEVNDLFLRLAKSLETLEQPEDDESHNFLISNLNKSLNLGEPRVRVLDTTLSLMCFTAPQVFDSLTEYLVKTIVTVLHSSIDCKALSYGTESVLQIGSVISSSDCSDVIDACADVLGKLKETGTLSSSLADAVVKMAVATPIFDVESIKSTSSKLYKLVSYMPCEISFESQKVPSRLWFWYLDPLILKGDISKMLKDFMGRPFLCLNTEFYHNTVWRSIIICLVFSPVMFIETRALLHNWFLATGLALVLEFQSELAAAILDIISRPVWWGLSAEFGSSLAFSYAYFPYNHNFFKILCGPISREGFLHLDECINKSISQKILPFDNKSMWSLALNFPDWFCYASVLLFCNSFNYKCLFGPLENDESAAARYMVWILDPTSELKSCSLADSLKKVSRLFSLNLEKLKKPTRTYRNKLKKPKSQSDGGDAIQNWLEDFHGLSSGFGVKKNGLFRKIPLGILIGFCEDLNEETCEVILRYVAIGKILPKKLTASKECSEEKEVFEGIRIVFNLTDAVERMADWFFEDEESRVDFVYRVKLRAGNYLIQCLMKLLDMQLDRSDQFVFFNDLHNRLTRWKEQGKAIFTDKKEFDGIIYALRSKLSSF